MGSLVYAHQLRRDGIPVAGMISRETIGFYSDARGSQKYPALVSLFYPSRGNFIAFVGNDESGDLVRRAVRRFRESARFPSEGIAGPPTLPGVGWSDHRSFWQEGYPAIMITDTAVFRYVRTITPLSTGGQSGFRKDGAGGGRSSECGRFALGRALNLRPWALSVTLKWVHAN